VKTRLLPRPGDRGHANDESILRRWKLDAGTVLLVVVAFLFLLIVLPILVKGEPLADDYYSCIRHTEVGLSGALKQSLSGTGAVRPARFLEILLLASLCRRVPFSLLMLVPLGLTLTVAYLIRGLVRDLGAPRPWPDVAAALWLLAPLGAESALWPSSLHVPLGMALALASLRSYRRERHLLAWVLALGAFLSLEQSIFALPLAAFLVTPPRGRMKALLSSGATALLVLISFAAWPGEDVRTAVSLGGRVTGLFKDPVWYVRFPAAGLGLHSIPLAVWWAFPYSLAILAAGAWLGIRLGRSMSRDARDEPRMAMEPGPGPKKPIDRGPGIGPSAIRVAAAGGVLALLVALPQMATVPRGVSGRIFAPIWLVMAAVLPLIAYRTGVPRVPWFWAGAGIFGAGAVLSLALAVSVRLHTADFTRASSDYIAARLTGPNEVVAVCDVRRTVVSPAPVGSFAIHEFIYDWSAQYALEYETARSAVFRLGGPLWGTRCPDLAGADVVVHFQQLRAAAGLHG
jgi:hypothetical protein